VISIISLLSSVAFAGLNSARAKAKDVVRKSDLQQIARANELYYDEEGKGSYVGITGFLVTLSNMEAVTMLLMW